MGEGNYRTDRGRTCHVSPILEEGEESFLWDDLHTDVLVAAPPSFEHCDYWHPNERNCKIIAQNAQHAVWLYENSYSTVFVTYGMLPDVGENIEPLARATLDDKARRFFDRLQESYPELRVATSPWTSTVRGDKTSVVA